MKINKINLFHIFILYYICSIKSKQLNIMSTPINAIKTIKTVVVDGITVVQLFINGKFHTEEEVTSQFSKKEIIDVFMNHM